MTGKKYLGMFALIAAATAVAGQPAQAAIILQDPGSIVVKQTDDHPCLFGGNSCNNPAGFDFALLSNNPPGDTYDAFAPSSSTTYTVGQIRDILALTDPLNFNTFDVGIDLNTVNPATEQLQLFAMLVNGVVVQSFSAAAPGQLLMTENNGTGLSDDLLLGFDLSSFAATDTVQFHLIENGARDGAEEYFLVNAANPEPVPEPSPLLLLGGGLIGLAFLSFRRRNLAA